MPDKHFTVRLMRTCVLFFRAFLLFLKFPAPLILKRAAVRVDATRMQMFHGT